MRSRFGVLPYLVGILCVSVFAGSAEGSQADRESARCEAAIARGARDGNVPQSVLHAISLTETGRRWAGELRPWPWAINREGQGYWFDTREEALAFARRSLAEGRKSFDVGCFQINYHWHGHNFPSLESMFDPEVGAAYAAGFLGQLFDETGDWSTAAGAYHSRTPHLARIYRSRFDRILEGVSDMPVVAEALESPAAPRKVRTRMTRGPLIIRVERSPAGEMASSGVPAGGTKGRVLTVRTERVEKPIAKSSAPRTIVAPRKPGSGDWVPASGSVRTGVR